MKKRLEFCKELKNDGCTENFWRNSISFYLDGTGFIYKQNRKDQATTTRKLENVENASKDYPCFAQQKGEKKGVRKQNSW